MSVSERDLLAALIAHETLAEQGPKGDKGDPGPPGRDGRDGLDGKDGRDGEPGASGPKGDRGPVGADGPIGRQGLQGVPGIPGLDGRDGRAGADGKPGADGTAGSPGERGLRGLPGAAGEKGDKGDPGKPGRDGSSAGAYTGIQIMEDGTPISSFALSLDFGSGVDVEMDRNVARVSVSPTAGSDANFVHDQIVAADTWTVAHNLGKKPSVTVVTSAGDVVEGDIHYVDDNNVELSFGAPFGGLAICN